MKQRMGQLERQMFAYLQLRGVTTVRTGDLAGPLRLSADQERKLLSRLARAKWIARVQRGVYLTPEKLPLGGVWSPDEAQALNALMAEHSGRYQICGLSAFNLYGYDEQVPNRTIAYNNRLSGERSIGAISLILIKVADRRLGATDRLRMRSGAVALYSSRARALLDAVYDWARFDTLPRAYGWIRAELRSGRVDADELVKLTIRYGDVGTIRRIGALLQRLRIPATTWAPLEAALRPSASVIPWIPRRPKRGRVDRRWGIVWNDSD
jgi:predicted transcriptional regulator of viral defense system